MQQTKPKSRKTRPAQKPGTVSRGPPVAISTKSKVTTTSFKPSPDGSIRICRTEFAGSITNAAVLGYSLSAISASTPGYDLNPACAALFPWLSTVADSYERFKFNSLSFRLIPSQATTTAGRVYCALDYDYDDPVATSKATLMSNLTVQEAPVWEEVKLKANASQLHPDMPFKYVSSSSRTNYVEPRTAFCGFLMVAFDTQTANLLYDLEVQYDVTLMVPVFEQSVALDGKPSAPAESNWVIGAINNGATYFSNLIPIGAAAAGLAVRTPGSLGVPSLNLSVVNKPATGAIDLQSLPRTRGSLTAAVQTAIAGITPSNQLTTYNPSIWYEAFNSLGTSLGQFTTGGGSTVPNTSGGNTVPVGWGTVGGYLETNGKLSLANLFASYPAVRWLVALLYTSSGITGSAKSFYQVEL